MNPVFPSNHGTGPTDILVVPLPPPIPTGPTLTNGEEKQEPQNRTAAEPDLVTGHILPPAHPASPREIEQEPATTAEKLEPAWNSHLERHRALDDVLFPVDQPFKRVPAEPTWLTKSWRWIRRAMRWYRKRVATPATEEEDAENQAFSL